MSEKELISKIRQVADEYQNETDKLPEYYIEQVIKILRDYDRRKPQ